MSETMQPGNTPCPVCGGSATVLPSGFNRFCKCPTCGDFRITPTTQVDSEIAYAVSAATREAHEQGRTLNLEPANILDLAEPHLRTTVVERMDKVLAYLASRTRYPGHYYTLEPGIDYPVADAHDGKELAAYLSQLRDEQLIVTGPHFSNNVHTVTVGGWARIQARPRPGGEPGRCFVACWLADEFYPAFRNAADEAIRACSYVPFWIGETPTNEGISDRILAEIRRAEFVIADFTGHRQSVYYEAGFARGLGRPVIWCCKQDDVPGLHFDTRHLGHVAWKDADDLRAKLEASIRANIISKA